MKVRVKEFGTFPTKAHPTDAGFDLYAPEDFTVLSMNYSDRINLGVGFEIPAGFVGVVLERSSQGKKGLFSIGPVVDCGYTGDVHLTLCNMSDEDVHYSKGDRVAQLVVHPISNETLELADELSGERGDNSHGSTGA